MLLDFLFPNRCLECNKLIDNQYVICDTCYQQIYFLHCDYTENHQFKQKCQTLFPVKNAFALFKFDKNSLARKIIHELKYKNREKVGKVLAEWTTQYLDFKSEKLDILTSIPIHPKKMKDRGYNQLHLFTEILSRYYSIPYSHTILRRTQHTKAQARKNKVERQKVSNIFTLNEPIENKHILLIDDVMTTGKTLSTAVFQLLKNNNEVSVLVMAMD